MFRVISLNKIGSAEPQQYTLVMKVVCQIL
jgi:hypothetical protein